MAGFAFPPDSVEDFTGLQYNLPTSNITGDLLDLDTRTGNTGKRQFKVTVNH